MINDPKDLEKILKLCRKYGLLEIDLQGFKAKFGDLPRDGKDVEPDVSDEPTGSDRFILEQLGLPVA